jgi:alkaline phosphatase D
MFRKPISQYQEFHTQLGDKMILRAFILSFLCSFGPILHSQECLRSGPMLGHISHHTASIWVQTNSSCEIILQFKNRNAEEWRSKRAIPLKSNFYTHTFLLDSLDPGGVYIYKLNELNYQFQTQVDWEYKIDPPEFTVAAGSCVYINEEEYDRSGKPYGQGSTIFSAIALDSPDVMLWLGDNTYLRPADVQSEYGIARRYGHTRADKNMQLLLASCASYAITDDHDFGPNNSGGFYPYRSWIKNVFDLFWPNPISGAHHERDLTSYFHYNGIDFFLLDNRSWREEPCDSCSLLSKSQVDWLIQNLKFSRSPFKMVAVGGQVLNTVARYENHARYAEEREYLISRIQEERIEVVIFLTGDRHMTELSRLELENGIEIYDLTISPLTSAPNRVSMNEENANRMKGTFVNVNNYALLNFSGTESERILNISIHNSKGEIQWKKELKSNDRK